ncbi:glycosyltransferase GtfE [Streptomyces lincolnensis]|uniref:Glycosyltransferase GtfE n=1 Tax=Streptomyces lincolnensis TaxID=1915 RepID=A0A1B1MMN3_STRLN|nr:hypothetical protein [Streptomyces lincolnensis]ANS69814.1 glycosyltransferase GtfE [Streptomyces lincolnensis]AXG58732.1 glycosyltransferase GtfE [Streptomyces lincolnensis]QMV11357.1 hypothetical protein GJU35_40550 [Streptomyces lincolnensis]
MPAPWPLQPSGPAVVQTGAWLLPDTRPLSGEPTRFLDAGEPPLYCGFGSGRARESVTKSVLDAARALGLRLVLSSGWAELSLGEDAPDCLPIGEVNQRELFRRVAAVIHHRGRAVRGAAGDRPAGLRPVLLRPPRRPPRHRRRTPCRSTHRRTPSSPLSAAPSATKVAERAGTVAASMRTGGALVAARRLIAAGA